MRGQRLLRLGLLIAAISAIPLGVQTPAYASSRCSACENQDPHTYRVYTSPYDSYLCETDAIPVDTVSIPGTSASVTLKYSPRCRTVWARTVGSGYSIFIVRQSPSTQLGCCAASSTDQSNPPLPYTNMLDDAGYISRAEVYDGRTIAYTKWY